MDKREYFAANIGAHLDRLFGAAMRLTRNRADAEDLVAETVTHGLSKIDALREPEKMLGWLLRMMTNLYISEKRKAREKHAHESYREEADSDEPAFSLFERLHQPFLLWWGNPEQEFLNKLLGEDIEAALNELPEQFRVAVMLTEIEGLSYQEIADSLNVPVGTVRSRLARGRSLLQKLLWRQASERGLVEADEGSGDD